MSLTMYGRRLVVSGLWSPDTVSRPTSVLVGLCLSIPVVNADVTQLVEPTAPEYARAAYGIGSAYWADDGYGGSYNAAQIAFPVVRTSWGLISGYAIIDPVANQILDSGPLSDSFVADVNMVPTIEPGSIMVSLSD